MKEQAAHFIRLSRRLIDYRMIWRWHFYAGLFCIPFIVVLCLTGPIYLFKPQIEAAIDAKYDHLAFSGAPASAQSQVAAALKAVPGSTFAAIEVRPDLHDAARITVVRHAEKIRVYVHPKTLQILKQVPENARFIEIVKDIHGELFAGRFGQIIVELAASWAIVMILTGLYLGWPRDLKGVAGLLYPRLKLGKRIFWRDIHAVTGLYISMLVLFLLLSGLPWTYVWGSELKAIRNMGHPAAAAGWSLGRADEKKTLQAERFVAPDMSRLDNLLDMSRGLDIAAPAILSPPDKGGHLWKLSSDNGNRPQRVTMMIDPAMLEVISRSDFRNKPLIDRIIGVTTAAHEGQLFGPFNQALGVITALGLLTLCASAMIMWWQRRPEGRLGAPMLMPEQKLGPGLAVIIIALGIFLPVFGISLIVIGLLEWGALRHIPQARQWLGLKVTASV
ncbi:PepSY domain-containing protein [Asticcacaulis sp. EMRT-3]|uniref:PepSY-associated TM helix domain-containing protein n=1 Tax=Asticcacaulis sp. EMRT-3 TaxID=3040349 RepID=UPI0024AFD24B|nr:PepSY domain-containing protein [Asticcacaulis sp. EMRT-3]MDI7774527.1 PepSY domain-containing protein [Asticcacaulis sp. EMRT-3]